jgi:hypothetical protein
MVEQGFTQTLQVPQSNEQVVVGADITHLVVLELLAQEVPVVEEMRHNLVQQALL